MGKVKGLFSKDKDPREWYAWAHQLQQLDGKATYTKEEARTVLRLAEQLVKDVGHEASEPYKAAIKTLYHAIVKTAPYSVPDGDSAVKNVVRQLKALWVNNDAAAAVDLNATKMNDAMGSNTRVKSAVDALKQRLRAGQGLEMGVLVDHAQSLVRGKGAADANERAKKALSPSWYRKVADAYNLEAPVTLDGLKKRALAVADAMDKEGGMVDAASALRRKAREENVAYDEVMDALVKAADALKARGNAADPASLTRISGSVATLQRQVAALRNNNNGATTTTTNNNNSANIINNNGAGNGASVADEARDEAARQQREVELRRMLDENGELLGAMAGALQHLGPPTSPTPYQPIEASGGMALPRHAPGRAFKHNFDPRVLYNLNTDLVAFTKAIIPTLEQRSLPELNGVMEQTLRSLDKGRSTDKDGRVLDQAGEKEKDRIHAAVRGVLKAFRRAHNGYYQQHLDWATAGGFTARHRYVTEWMEIIKERKQHHREQDRNNPPKDYTEYDEALKEYERVFLYGDDRRGGNLFKLQEQVMQFGSGLNEILTKAWLKLVPYVSRVDDAAVRDALKQDLEATRAYINTVQAKILSLYGTSNGFADTMMQLMTDSKFVAMYVLKAVQFAFFAAAVAITSKLFQEWYMRKVYAQNAPPPSIHAMLGLLLAVHMGFMLFIITVLVLLMYIFNTPSNDFIISPRIIRAFLQDYAAFLVLFASLAALIGQTIQVKRYFKYQTEGLRGIRAYKDMMLALAGVLVLLPYYAFF